MRGQIVGFSDGLYQVRFKDKKSGYITANVAQDNVVALKRTAWFRHAGKLVALLTSLVLILILTLPVHTGPKIDLCSNGHVNGAGAYILTVLATFAALLPGLALISFAMKLRSTLAQMLVGLISLPISFIAILLVAGLLNMTDCGFVTY